MALETFQPVFGTYTGTGAAQSVVLGFVPRVLMIWNSTDGDVLNIKLNGTTDATHISIGTASSLVSSNGITLLNSASTGQGFTVGTDNSVSENAKTFQYMAF